MAARAVRILTKTMPPASALSPTAPQAAASVLGVSKRFGKTSVLEDISFDVAEGEALVLLGASGSGKTTILRIIAGLEQPYTGKVCFTARTSLNCRRASAASALFFSSMHCFRK